MSEVNASIDELGLAIDKFTGFDIMDPIVFLVYWSELLSCRVQCFIDAWC
jgi:hypothetical protein